jgi:hypothetical protein
LGAIFAQLPALPCGLQYFFSMPRAFDAWRARYQLYLGWEIEGADGGQIAGALGRAHEEGVRSLLLALRAPTCAAKILVVENAW